MNRRALGRLLTALGAVLSLVGAAGLVLDRPAAAPDPAVAVTPSDAQASATPSPDGVAEPAEIAAFGEADDAEADLYSCAEPHGAATEQADWLDVTSVRARQAEHPVTGETGDSLLVRLRRPSEDPSVSFTAVALVEPEGMPDERGALGLPGVQWLLVYEGGQFQRGAYRVGEQGVEPVSDEAFRVRYEGLGEAVEIEFYGPAGTSYHAVLLSDGERCDTVLPEPA